MWGFWAKTPFILMEGCSGVGAVFWANTAQSAQNEKDWAKCEPWRYFLYDFMTEPIRYSLAFWHLKSYTKFWAIWLETLKPVIGYQIIISVEPLRYIYETLKKRILDTITPLKMAEFSFQDGCLSLPWWRPSFWTSKLIHIMSHIDINIMTCNWVKKFWVVSEIWLLWDK